MQVDFEAKEKVLQHKLLELRGTEQDLQADLERTQAAIHQVTGALLLIKELKAETKQAQE